MACSTAPSLAMSQLPFCSLHTLRDLLRKKNVVLMGPPGCGKTSVGALVSQKLGMPFIDVDDDHLEPLWGTSVADKLSALGDEQFLQEEGLALQKLKTDAPTVISLSGSNPLHAESMQHIHQDGLLVFLDVSADDIERRMQHMKVDRIVGCGPQRSLREVLDSRIARYNSLYDLRVIVPPNLPVLGVADLVLKALDEPQDFFSTRGFTREEPLLEFCSVVKQGLADDKGLFLPHSYRKFSTGELERVIACEDYRDIATRVMERFPLGHMPPGLLAQLIREAYSTFGHPSVQPVTELEGNQFLMETYHGPTAAFKDLSLQLTPKLLSYASQQNAAGQSEMHTGLLVATSGDTGCAALDGFSRQPNTPVVVLYPQDGVSVVQKAQMRTKAGDVFVLGVNGDFDQCQHLAKAILNDQKLQEEFARDFKVSWSSGNSINWGRFLPQVVFTFGAYASLAQRGYLSLGDSVNVCIPTGNFGNILGAYYAKRLGLPISHLICASNENNVLTDFLRTGVYDLRDRAFHQTVAPSIDILVSSNLERFLFLLFLDEFSRTGVVSARKEACAATKQLFEQLTVDGCFSIPPWMLDTIHGTFSASWCSQSQALETIHGVYNRTGRLIDPHTAVAKFVADQLPSEMQTSPLLLSSTAHYAKFPEATLEALKGNFSYLPGGVDGSGDALLSLFSQLHRVAEQVPNPAAARLNAMHPGLERAITLPVLHTRTCEPEVAPVVQEIRSFLAGRRQ